MPVQDGLQSAGTLTATTSAAISVAFPFRASSFQVTAATSGGCFLDVTGGVGVLATTSAGYPMAASEKVSVPLGGSQPRRPGVYSGFSILGTVGAISTVRYLALG